MGSFSIWHLLILAAVVFVLFGTGRVSDLMGDVAKGIKNFRQGLREEDDDNNHRPGTKPPPSITAERRDAETRSEQTKEHAGH